MARGVEGVFSRWPCIAEGLEAIDPAARQHANDNTVSCSRSASYFHLHLGATSPGRAVAEFLPPTAAARRRDFCRSDLRLFASVLQCQSGVTTSSNASPRLCPTRRHRRVIQITVGQRRASAPNVNDGEVSSLKVQVYLVVPVDSPSLALVPSSVHKSEAVFVRLVSIFCCVRTPAMAFRAPQNSSLR